MTRLTDLVRSEFTTLADTGTPPTDLADRAVAAGVRRARRRYAAIGGATVAAAVTVALAATQVVAPQARQPDQGPAAPEPRNVVFAMFREGGTSILDPSTGQYRTPEVSLVMDPSADLRYAPVLPVVPEMSDPSSSPLIRRAGRYDTVTGDIRWFDLPRRWAAPPTISPDGRYLAAPITGGTSTGIVVVDTTDGTIEEFDMAPDTLAALDVVVGGVSFDRNPPDIQPRGFPDVPLGWLPDSRHVLFGSAILDLTGRRTGTLPMPDAWLIAPRPNGGALFVSKDALDSLKLSDAAGKVETGATLDWTCGTKPPTVCPRAYFSGFLGWRGDRQILMESPDEQGGIDAVDVRTGARTRVTTYDAKRVLVAPADSLSPSVREAVAF